jgi:hypothetical protein
VLLTQEEGSVVCVDVVAECDRYVGERWERGACCMGAPLTEADPGRRMTSGRITSHAYPRTCMHTHTPCL